MANELKAIASTDTELRVGNYMILFGGEDLAGEFFTKSTRFDSGYTELGVLYEDFEHGLDVDGLGNNKNNVIGIADWKSAKIDDTGIFVERILNRRADYVQYMEMLIEAGVLGTSSEAVGGMTRRKSSGEITDWPLMRDSLTVTPMEPRMVTSNIVTAAKALHKIFPQSKSLNSLTANGFVEKEIRLTDIKTAEQALRDAGFSRTEAKRILACGFKSVDQRDAEGLDEAINQVKKNILLLSSN